MSPPTPVAQNDGQSRFLASVFYKGPVSNAATRPLRIPLNPQCVRYLCRLAVCAASYGEFSYAYVEESQRAEEEGRESFQEPSKNPPRTSAVSRRGWRRKVRGVFTESSGRDDAPSTLSATCSVVRCERRPRRPRQGWQTKMLCIGHIQNGHDSDRKRSS